MGLNHGEQGKGEEKRGRFAKCRKRESVKMRLQRPQNRRRSRGWERSSHTTNVGLKGKRGNMKS